MSEDDELNWDEPPKKASKRRGRAKPLSEASTSMDPDVIAQLFSPDNLVATTINGKKMWACPIAECAKAFERRYDLDRHSWIHRTDRPFVCPVKTCGKSFIRKDYQKKHMRQAHKDVPVSSSEEEDKTEAPKKKRKVVKRNSRKRRGSSSEDDSPQDLESHPEDVSAAEMLTKLGTDTVVWDSPELYNSAAIYSSRDASTPITAPEDVKVPKKRGRKKKVVVDEHIQVNQHVPRQGMSLLGWPNQLDSDDDDSSGLGTRPPSASLPATLVPTTNNSTSQTASAPHTPPSSPPSHHNQVQNLFSAESASATKYKRHDFNQTPSAKYGGYHVEATNDPVTPFLSPLLTEQNHPDTFKSMIFTGGPMPTQRGSSIRVTKHDFSSRSSSSTLVSVETPLGAKSVASTSSDGSTSLKSSSTRKVLFRVDRQTPPQALVDPKDLTMVHQLPEEPQEDETEAAVALHRLGSTPPRTPLPLASYKTPKLNAKTTETRGGTMSPEFSSFLVSNPSTPM